MENIKYWIEDNIYKYKEKVKKKESKEIKI